MIKAVFFDYDGVLTTDKTGSLTTTRYLSEASGIELSALRAVFSRFNTDLTLGKTTHLQIWQEVCSALGQELDTRLLFDAFESTPMNTGMFALARELKRTHLVGIITDNKKDRMDHLKRHQGLASLFNPIVVSAEVGADKRSDQIFLHALRLAGVSAEEAVFIDNSQANLAVPNALGFKTIFHDDEKNDIESLSKSLKAFGLFDKFLLQQQVLERLAEDLLQLEQAVRAAHETATHEENIAENKYDTLGLEAAYLATGQARRADGIRQAMANWRQFRPGPYDASKGIQLGALVCLVDADDRQQQLLLGPDGGSMKLVIGAQLVQVISSEAPLGRAMLGKCEGDEVSIQVAQIRQQFEVLWVR